MLLSRNGKILVTHAYITEWKVLWDSWNDEQKWYHKVGALPSFYKKRGNGLSYNQPRWGSGSRFFAWYIFSFKRIIFVFQWNTLIKQPKHSKHSKFKVLMNKWNQEFKNFPYSGSSQAAMSLSLLILLHNEANSSKFKQRHIATVSVNFSWYFVLCRFEYIIRMNATVLLKRYLDWDYCLQLIYYCGLDTLP